MEESRSLPELMSISIYSCQELEHIVLANEELVLLPNAEVYFPKLTDVIVSNCNKLKSLFPVSMSKMLPQLSTLWITDSDQIEEVFRHDGGDRTIDEMEVILPNLTEIILMSLLSFVDICQGYKLQAVKLGRLMICDCPKVCQSLKAVEYIFICTFSKNSNTFLFYFRKTDVNMLVCVPGLTKILSILLIKEDEEEPDSISEDWAD